MRKDGLVVIFGPAVLFCHGFCPPLRKAKTMTITIAGDNELISADRQIKKCTVQVIDLLQTVDRLQQIYDLNSTLFDLSVSGNQLVITGYGYGHGLGLSQWGAEAMAEKHGGAKDYYKTILTHYFTGTKVEKIY